MARPDLDTLSEQAVKAGGRPEQNPMPTTQKPTQPSVKPNLKERRNREGTTEDTPAPDDTSV